MAVRVLPARSLTDAVAARSSPSPVTMLSVGAWSTPERASSAVQRTVTSPRYQPFSLGAVVAAPLSVGRVSSTSIPVKRNGVADVVRRVGRGAVDALARGPRRRSRRPGQVSTPESASWSAQVNVATTSALNQPWALGRADSEPVTVGRVSSTLSVVSSVAVLPAWSVAVPTTRWAAPSPRVTGLGAGGDPGAGVGAAEGDRDVAVVPAPLVGGRRLGVGDARRRPVDPHLDVLLRLDVAGHVHAPHLEGVDALGVDRDAGARLRPGRRRAGSASRRPRRGCPRPSGRP